MRHRFVHTSLFLMLATVLVASSLLTMQLVARASQDARVTLAGQNVPLLWRAHVVRAADPALVLHLSLGLQPADPAGLDRLLHAISTPGSPWYHRYLTAADFTRLFAPDPGQVARVVSFLQSQGMSVQSVASNRLLIDATATVGMAERAFAVQINEYTDAHRAFYANAQAPSVPAALQSILRSIGGLATGVRYRPRVQRAPAATSGYGPAELSRAYNTAPVASMALQGAGQTVALFELDGYQAADVGQYFQRYALGTPALSDVLVDGVSGAAGQDALEVELDIEVVGAVAPRATQLVYEGPNSTQGINDTYNRIITDDRARVISTSWGLCESSTGQAELLILDTMFKQAAAQGISLYAAAGDLGAYDCGDSSLAVDSPADDPYVTGVGGTHLQPGVSGGYGSESAWSDASETRGGPAGAGGGGGVSSVFVQPAWQSGIGAINGSGSGQLCSAPTGQYCREVPDVSADADPASGYAVYCTVAAAGCASTGWITVGGTSAAAPFWAGSTALINQSLQEQNLPELGWATPALYALSNSQQAAFHDITTGDNLHYPASVGYDLASGLGSPDVSALAHDLASGGGGVPPTPVPTATPTPVSTPTPVPGRDLLQNTGFEQGHQSWQETSSGGYQIVSTLNPHAGGASVYLCGYAACDDRIWQRVPVPSVYASLSLAYWWFSESAQTGPQCLDSFLVVLQTAAGAVIKTLQHDCNTDPTDGWVQRRIDVSGLLAPYRGQRVSLLFRGTTRAGSTRVSAFFVDDVTMLAL